MPQLWLWRCVNQHRLSFAFVLVVLASSALLIWNPIDDNPILNRTLVFTIVMAFCWMTEYLPIPITSLLPLVLCPLLQILPADKVAKSYMNDNIFLFIGSSLVTVAMEQWGLHVRIALRTLMVVGNRPVLLLGGFMVVTATLSMFLNNSATTVLMMPLAISILQRIGSTENANDKELSPTGATSANRNEGQSDSLPLLEEADTLEEELSPPANESGGALTENQRRYASGLLLSVAYSASLGGGATIIGTGTNLAMNMLFAQLFPRAPALSFLAWFLFALPLVALFLAFAFLVLHFTYCRAAVKEKSITFDSHFLATQYANLGAPSFEDLMREIAGCIFGVFISWFTLEFWSEWFNDAVDYGTIAIAFAVLLFVVPSRSKPSTTLLEWKTAGKQIPWGVVLLLGGGFALADSFKESGLSVWIGKQLTFFAKFPLLILIGAICSVLTLLTELTSNVATATIILPIVAALAVAIGENPLLLMIPATFTCGNAFMLPVGTPPNAIVFSSGHIRITEMIRAGFLLTIFGVVINSCWIFVLGPTFFDIELHEVPDWALPTNATDTTRDLWSPLL